MRALRTTGCATLLAEFYAKRTLTHQPIEPEDCAAAILFLAGPQSRCTTGHLIPVDGGLDRSFSALRASCCVKYDISEEPIAGNRRNRKAVVAVDLGAQSCRVSLLRWKQGIQPIVEVIHQVYECACCAAGGLRWDIERIWEGVKAGLVCARGCARGIATIGVDGWAVDYVRCSERMNAEGNPFCYRDARTERGENEVHERIPPESYTAYWNSDFANQHAIPTICRQIGRDRDAKKPWLNLPEYIDSSFGRKTRGGIYKRDAYRIVGLGSQHWCRRFLMRLDRYENGSGHRADGTTLGGK